jgi:hypothetical protein
MDAAGHANHQQRARHNALHLMHACRSPVLVRACMVACSVLVLTLFVVRLCHGDKHRMNRAIIHGGMGSYSSPCRPVIDETESSRVNELHYTWRHLFLSFPFPAAVVDTLFTTPKQVNFVGHIYFRRSEKGRRNKRLIFVSSLKPTKIRKLFRQFVKTDEIILFSSVWKGPTK